MIAKEIKIGINSFFMFGKIAIFINLTAVCFS